LRASASPAQISISATQRRAVSRDARFATDAGVLANALTALASDEQQQCRGRLLRAAAHGASSAGWPGGDTRGRAVASVAAPTLPQVPSEPPRETTDPDGRLVRFDERTEAHLARRRPQMVRHVPAILDAIRRPDVREEDAAPGRERFYRRDLDPRRWLRVVVDFNESPALVVTAFVQDHPPEDQP
jgi:hypothetical protein